MWGFSRPRFLQLELRRAVGLLDTSMISAITDGKVGRAGSREIEEDACVLLVDIVTPADLVSGFEKRARPFFGLDEIEQRFRPLIEREESTPIEMNESPEDPDGRCGVAFGYDLTFSEHEEKTVQDFYHVLCELTERSARRWCVVEKLAPGVARIVRIEISLRRRLR